MLEIITQIWIGYFGVLAVWMSQAPQEGRRRYACIYGLIGQPAWFVAAWQAQQWGIFFVTILYTVAWFRGYRRHWMP